MLTPLFWDLAASEVPSPFVRMEFQRKKRRNAERMLVC